MLEVIPTPAAASTSEKQGLASPFLKWVGGKRQLLSELKAHMPPALAQGKITRYIEPFLGGGALFFHLLQHYPIKEAHLSDQNPDLMLTYRIVRDQIDALIEKLYLYQEKYEAAQPEAQYDLFMTLRHAFNQAKEAHLDHRNTNESAIEQAARFIFLNKTCYNGLFRTNQRGFFNTPFGKYTKPTICDETNLRAASALLQRAKLRCASYSTCEAYIEDRNTFVYFDPPYRPLSHTSAFTTYTGQSFTDRDQQKLAAFFTGIHKEKKAYLMLSNSDPTYTNPQDMFFETLYSDFHRHRVMAKRAINCKGNKRGKIPELLITNYKPHSHVLQPNYNMSFHKYSNC